MQWIENHIGNDHHNVEIELEIEPYKNHHSIVATLSGFLGSYYGQKPQKTL